MPAVFRFFIVSYTLRPLTLLLLTLLPLTLSACGEAQQLTSLSHSPSAPPSAPPPEPLLTRLLSLGEERSACLQPLISALSPQILERHKAQDTLSDQLTPGRCHAILQRPSPELPSAYVLWAEERLSVGGAWGEQAESEHSLRALIWGAGLPLSERWGALQSITWARWGERVVLKGRTPYGERPPQGALWLITLKRPPKPSAERGGWWAHVALWLPIAHLGYWFTLTHPQGWPVGSFGPTPLSERLHASLLTKRWWVPPARASKGRALYLSLTPSWEALTRWAWAQLSAPLLKRPLDPRLSEGSEAALEGPEALSAWVRARVRYHYSPLRRYQPSLPLETLRRGSGDCKDMSALAHQLLKQAGQPSWFALTSQRPLLASAREVPSMGWFDHVLLWQPSLEERARVEAARRAGEALSSPLNAWIDLTQPRGEARGLEGRWAYVLLSEREGAWIQLSDLKLTRP